MTTVSRRVAAISSIFVIALLSTAPVGAQTMDHGKSDAEMSRSQAESPYADAMDSMMHSMETVEETGNPDADFLLLMIPHHQSAVDMARTLLERSRSDDAEVAAMAQAVIDTQEAEISAMKVMLARLGYPVK
ncbi:DUF305 domain-containing protein [Roseicyclus sp. F158]|uniref:DUF305 domain-containing protein n=1 Tax=Tropicimonas omnivorans TaxID=3075590 RepID=A0ABU3DHA7_9RHOB|nr:DUF305 domain-containing protein [Roseicyclus sp. F158]MDT0683096.1 DUF305 domain-containing protein [Roseicyclus sp. F158]